MEGEVYEYLGSPPHTRGTPVIHFCSGKCSGITPAYAGNTRFLPALLYGFRDHPRIRGEHSMVGKSRINSKGSPPHTRGTPVSGYKYLLVIGITPAYAGNTFIGAVPSIITWDHPRIRGEHAQSVKRQIMQKGSPPHTRGTPIRSIASVAERGITPAYAGNTIVL